MLFTIKMEQTSQLISQNSTQIKVSFDFYRVSDISHGNKGVLIGAGVLNRVNMVIDM